MEHSIVRASFLGVLQLGTMGLMALPASAFFEDSNLVSINVGSPLSDAIRNFSGDGFELSDGTPIQFGDWYDSYWRDLQVVFVTELSSNFGIYWGFGTGENAEKYFIEPSLRLGFVTTAEISKHEFISFSALAILGGRLKERACLADYGAIGGRQTVNCRLAAAPIAPSDTLRFLLDEPPPDRLIVSFRYEMRF
jgi:hypothetical protein